MNRPLRTERPEPPKHEKIGMTLRFYFNLEGRRKSLAQDRRMRNTAKRLDLKAKHHRVIGGWSAISSQSGETVIERCCDYELEQQLNDLIAKMKEGRT